MPLRRPCPPKFARDRRSGPSIYPAFCAGADQANRAQVALPRAMYAGMLRPRVICAGIAALGRGARARRNWRPSGRRVGPDITDGVGAVQHGAELATVIRHRIGLPIAPQQPVLAVDGEMIFVTEPRHRDLRLAPAARTRRRLAPANALDHPAPVAVDLGASRRFPLGGHVGRLLLGLGQPRPAPRHHRGVNDLTNQASGAQQRVKLFEPPLRHVGPGQLLAQKPDCRGIGNSIVQG